MNETKIDWADMVIIMKTFFKNATYYLSAAAIFLMIWVMFKIAVLYISAWAGVETMTVVLCLLIMALVGAAVKTIGENHRKQRVRRVVPVLLDDEIRAQKNRLENIEAETDSIGKTRRLVMCKMTLDALEEKRERIVSGKEQRAQNETEQ